MSERIWLITGASRGLGLALTRRVLARGDRVIATGRDVAAFDELLADPDIDASHVFPLRLDVTDTPENLRKVMDEAVAHWGRVDVLVNNAGTREISIVEEADPNDFMIVAKTNYFGVINVTNALLPHLRARRSGLIVVIGTRSVFRDEIPGLALYTSTKAAVHAYAETLSAEMKPFNIDVVIVAPGAFDSGLALTIKPGKTISDYDDMRKEMYRRLAERREERNPGDPVKGMDALVDAVRSEGRAAGKKGVPLWLFLGDDAISDVRGRLQQIHDTIDEWESVGTRLGKLD